MSPAFEREITVPYTRYHLEITATDDQEMQLKKTLLAKGLAVNFKPFDMLKHQKADYTNDFQQGYYESVNLTCSFKALLYQYTIQLQKVRVLLTLTSVPLQK